MPPWVRRRGEWSPATSTATAGWTPRPPTIRPHNVSILINDGDWPTLNSPSITINDVTVTEGNTGTVNATFTVSLSAASSQTVTVHYATADGSATTAGGDYQAVTAR